MISDENGRDKHLEEMQARIAQRIEETSSLREKLSKYPLPIEKLEENLEAVLAKKKRIEANLYKIKDESNSKPLNQRSPSYLMPEILAEQKRIMAEIGIYQEFIKALKDSTAANAATTPPTSEQQPPAEDSNSDISQEKQRKHKQYISELRDRVSKAQEECDFAELKYLNAKASNNMPLWVPLLRIFIEKKATLTRLKSELLQADHKDAVIPRRETSDQKNAAVTGNTRQGEYTETTESSAWEWIAAAFKAMVSFIRDTWHKIVALIPHKQESGPEKILRKSMADSSDSTPPAACYSEGSTGPTVTSAEPFTLETKDTEAHGELNPQFAQETQAHMDAPESCQLNEIDFKEDPLNAEEQPLPEEIATIGTRRKF